jgi:hypothetical protein
VKTRLIVALCVPLAILSACNIFDPIDSPNTDAQILSAARAAMDRGDFEGARQEYAKLSQSDETVASEEAFNELNEAGATMGNFMAAFGGGGSGEAITALANSLANGAGESKRLAIYSAYSKVSSITTNTQLRGLVRLTAGLALAAEILAEQATNAGVATILEQEDIVTNPSGCNSVTCLGTGCAAPGGTLALGAAVDISPTPADSTDLSGSATLRMFNAAIDAVNDAITEVGASGKFSTGTGGLASGLLTIGTTDCYRFAMLEQGIGE